MATSENGMAAMISKGVLRRSRVRFRFRERTREIERRAHFGRRLVARHGAVRDRVEIPTRLRSIMDSSIVHTDVCTDGTALTHPRVPPETVRPWAVLRRGLRRQCPHCGNGSLLQGWAMLRTDCPACGIVYERSPGDTWAFWIIGHRILLFPAIAAVFFGVGPRSWVQGLVILGAFGAGLLVTLPQQIGLVTALDYLSRRYWPDPADIIPPLPPRAPSR